MALSKDDVLFGRIVIHNKLAAESQVKECIAVAEREGKDLGTVMRARGVLGEKQVELVRAHVRKKSGDQAESPAAAPAAPPPGRAPRAGIVTVGEMAQRDFGQLADTSLHELLREVRTCGVSDLHCQVGAPPFVRLHGSLVYLKHPPYVARELASKIDDLLGAYERGIFEKHWDVDFCLETEHGRYRTSVFKQRMGTDAVFRVIPTRIPTVEELHLPDQIKRFTKYSQGIVLITGPAGSGKSATMAALVELINEERHDHIVIVEDPIEYLFESRNCNVNQRQVKVHTLSFAAALRSALRADPDVIVIGEMRDLETVSIAITAAETGHLVLATLHTTNAVRSVDRIIDVFPPKEQAQIRAMVSESMRGVISQQLIPRRDGMGREPSLEIMFSSPAVANMIRESKTFQLTSVLQTGARQGMKLMDDSLQELLNKGLITREAACHYANSPDRFGRQKGEVV